MEPVAGALLAPLILLGTAYANYLTSTYGATANYWALGVHISSWVAQFIGHGIFEGRAPALLDNLIQAIFLAPLFVWLEVLFYLGYRPDLKGRLDDGVEKEVANFQSTRKMNRARLQTNGVKRCPEEIPFERGVHKHATPGRLTWIVRYANINISKQSLLERNAKSRRTLVALRVV